MIQDKDGNQYARAKSSLNKIKKSIGKAAKSRPDLKKQTNKLQTRVLMIRKGPTRRRKKKICKAKKQEEKTVR